MVTGGEFDLAQAELDAVTVPMLTAKPDDRIRHRPEDEAVQAGEESP
jgi:hypothetical protein